MRTTAASSKSRVSVPIVCVVSWPLPATITTAFARDDHDVAGARFRERTLDRAAAIGLFDPARAFTRRTRRRLTQRTRAGSHRAGDRDRIFTPRVVAREDRDVRERVRQRPHHRAFALVAFAAAAEDEHHTTALSFRCVRSRDLAGAAQRSVERVGGVGVVDDHEGLAGDELEAAAHAGEGLQPATDRLPREAERFAGERGRERVLRVHVAADRELEATSEGVRAFARPELDHGSVAVYVDGACAEVVCGVAARGFVARAFDASGCVDV